MEVNKYKYCNCLFATLKKTLLITTNRPGDHHNSKYTRQRWWSPETTINDNKALYCCYNYTQIYDTSKIIVFQI